MRQIRLISAFIASLVLAGCGGGGAGDQTTKIKFSSLVTFGDSLSDVGTYQVGQVAAAGGGQFTINGVSKNWTGFMAAQLGLSAPCAAVTGGYGVTPAAHSGCYAYAQGGARVFGTTGVGNTDATNGQYSGALTYPVTTQIANHLATTASGQFSGNEVVFVLAGANDILIEAQLAYPGYVSACMGSGMTGCTGGGLSQTAAQAAALQIALGDLTGVADALAAQITTNITGKGANHVVVLNIPDISSTPLARSSGASAQQLFGAFVTTFNAELEAKLAGDSKVLLVDTYSVNRDQISHPAQYGLTNVTDTACDVNGTYLQTYFKGSSLGCTPQTLISGVTGDAHYLYADSVHPTPWAYQLMANLVSKHMLVKGWM